MGRQHDLSNLWGSSFSRFSREVKQHYGLNEKCHIRYCEDRSGKCMVYVVKRSGPSRGFDRGNFAIDVTTLRWMVRQLNANKINSAYVVLAEDYGGDIVTWDTAKNVESRIGEAEPYVGAGDFQYYWMNGELELVGGSTMVGDSITEPPF